MANTRSSGSTAAALPFSKAAALMVLVPAFLILTSHSLQARTRDEVIAGLFRCAAIGDTRTWLDCYYGAAQPLRAALGLQPAPPGQVRLSQNPPVGSPTGDLSERYLATADALRCNSNEDRDWLDCYYGAAQPVRGQLGLAPAPQSQIVSGGTRVLPGPSNGSQLALSKSPFPAQPGGIPGHYPVSSQMVSYSFNRFRMFTVTLANGQTWRQLSGDTSFAHWVGAASRYSVKITQGALDSLNLQVKGSPVAYKVEQIN